MGPLPNMAGSSLTSGREVNTPYLCGRLQSVCDSNQRMASIQTISLPLILFPGGSNLIFHPYREN